MKGLKSTVKKSKSFLIYKDLKKAYQRLQEAVNLPQTVFNQDATIKRFEFCFELSWKLMKTIADLEGLDSRSPKGAIRQSAVLNLINNPEVWFEFLEARNLTVHTYKEEIARKVYKKAKEFVAYVEELINSAKQYL